MIPNRPLFAALIALSAAPLLLALTLPAFSSHGPKTLTTPQQVAALLDSIVQPRFQDTSAGKFGVSRLGPVVPGHQNVGVFGYFPTSTPLEAALLAKADAARRPYVIAFLHCVAVPGARPSQHPADDPLPSLRTIVVTNPAAPAARSGYPGDYLHKTEPLLQTAAVEALTFALQGKPVQTQAGDWAIFLRPVRASQQTCLTCHTTAKQGDTLGVMVYAVGRNFVPAVLPISVPGKPPS